MSCKTPQRDQKLFRCLAGITSLCTVALIAVERMFVICKPLGPMKFQKNHALAGIVLSWLWSLTWNVPPLLGWGRYELEGVGTSCAPDWHNREPLNVSYIVTYFAVCFAVPFTIIIGSYSKLMWTLHQVRGRGWRDWYSGGSMKVQVSSTQSL